MELACNLSLVGTILCDRCSFIHERMLGRALTHVHRALLTYATKLQLHLRPSSRALALVSIRISFSSDRDNEKQYKLKLPYY